MSEDRRRLSAAKLATRAVTLSHGSSKPSLGIAGNVTASPGSRILASEHAQLAFFGGGQKVAIPGERLTPSVCGNFGVK